MAGKIFSAGLNGNGQLGLGDTTNRSSLTQIGTAEDWVWIAATPTRTFAVKSDGTLWAWGNNDYGQLGLGDTTQRTSPVQVGSATNWVSGSAGTDHALFIRADGTLWAWGWNGNGQLGLGDTTARDVPVQVGSATDWAAASAGDDFSLAITTGGTLWSWGNGADYRTGHGDETQRTSPVQVGSVSTWSLASAGKTAALALRTDGTMWVWGRNDMYQLGLSDGLSRTAPTQVRVGETFSAIATGPGAEYAMAVRSDGTLWCAGQNGAGQLGTSDTTTRTVWTQSGTDTDWSGVYANGLTSSMIKSAGTLWACGSNVWGQLGRGDTASPQLTPVQIGSASNWSMVGDGYSHTVALTTTATGDTYTAAAPVTFSVEAPVRASAPISFVVGDGGVRAAAPLTVTLTDPVRASAAVSFTVGALYRATAPVPFVVFDPDLEIGRGWWKLRVLMDDVDISDRLTGAWWVDAEEGAARVAEFTIRPEAGPVAPAAWLAKPIKIDYVQAGLVWRLFTGIVSQPEVDVVRGLVKFHCTDNLQRIIDAKTRAEIDALTPGAYWSRFVFSADAQGWEYLQNRRETLRAEVDLSPWGVIRTTPWLAATPEKTFTESGIVGRPRIAMTQADQLVNRVDIELSASLPKLRAGRMLVGWSYDTTAPMLYGRPWYAPDIETVQSAFDDLGDGWETTTLLITPVSGGDTGHVRSVAATLTRRWVQDHVWRHTLTLRAPASISVYGELTARENGSVGYAYDERRWTDDGVAVQETAPETDPDEEIDIAVLTLLGIGWRRILSSHRDNEVSVEVPLEPSLDLAHTYRVDTASVQATGKARRVRFEGDLGTGRSRATLTLAISGAGFSGGAYSPATLTVPARPEPDADPVLAGPNMVTQVMIWPPEFFTTPSSPDWDLDGWSAELHGYISGRAPAVDSQLAFNATGRLSTLTGVLFENARTVTSISYQLVRAEFKVTAPEVSSIYIDAREMPVSASHSIAIPEDEFIQTFQEAL